MKKISCLVLFFGFILTLMGQSVMPVTVRSAQTVDTTVLNYQKTGETEHRQVAVYDQDLDGSRTASGEMFHNVRFTAGANNYPFNTWLLVTNPRNQKSVIVRVNDRLSRKASNQGIALQVSRAVADSIGLKGGKQFKLNIDIVLPTDSLSFNKDQVMSFPPIDSAAPNTFKPKGKSINGIASFYSFNLDGTKTSTGERYRNSKFTAASNHFKLNTWVLVTNLHNKKSVIVRINDHMHPRMKKKGRVVDLSREAAKQLDFIDRGLTKVKVQPIEFIFDPELKLRQDSLVRADSLRTISDSARTGEPMEEEEAGITGIASFYSTNLDGTKTATGETYRNNRMSAASNDFDLNTWVKITNLKNNKSVVLRINDRMHPKMQRKGRVVDLSRIAAKKLDFIKSGLVKVKVEKVSKDDL